MQINDREGTFFLYSRMLIHVEEMIELESPLRSHHTTIRQERSVDTKTSE